MKRALALEGGNKNRATQIKKLKQQLDRAVEQWEEASIELDEFKNT